MNKDYKIGLISIGAKAGYGGSFQAYALQKAIKTILPTSDCEYIQYLFPVKKHTLIWFFRKIISKIIRRNDEPSLSIKEFIDIFFMMFTGAKINDEKTQKSFNDFWSLTEYSQPIRRKHISKLNNEYDAFIVGSDQTWNCGRLNFDGTFFLDFVTDAQKKYSYAPSLALKEIPQKYKAKYSSCLGDYQYLSCREESSAKILENLLRKKVQVVLDPVFLFPKEHWFSLSDMTMKVPEKYCLGYIIDSSASLEEQAMAYAEHHSMECIILYGDSRKNKSIGPAQWLRLFSQANMVFTNSFHATCFSVIFERQFFTEITATKRFEFVSSRIIELLDLFSLKERLIGTPIQYNTIQYNTIRQGIQNKIAESQKYLEQMLKTIEKSKNA